ncbi:unnamed protein product [Meganyctiphanes norvegica]|uniref:Uncharacterized protein n=1 Tax=Meganyctiphanes norvegica TaxID=48144 RepID=A0AAV2RIF2_MEGNR
MFHCGLVTRMVSRTSGLPGQQFLGLELTGRLLSSCSRIRPQVKQHATVTTPLHSCHTGTSDSGVEECKAVEGGAPNARSPPDRKVELVPVRGGVKHQSQGCGDGRLPHGR